MRVLAASLIVVLFLGVITQGQTSPLKSSSKQSRVSDRGSPFADSPAGRTEWFLHGRREVKTRGEALPPPPAHRLRNSFAQLDLALASPAASRSVRAQREGSPVWTEAGPRPQINSDWGAVAGRVTSVALDLINDPSGNTLYVGTAFGGVWKTSNALSSSPDFVPLMDDKANITTMSVGSIAIDSSSNPPVLYVGSGEANNAIDSYYGLGIYKSDDGGISWLPAVSTDDENHSFEGGSVSRILIDPYDHKTLLAAVSDAGDPNSSSSKPDFGIYGSNNMGMTWHRMLAEPCTDMVYEPVRREYYAAVRGLGIFKYRIGGTWAATTSPFQSAEPNGKTFYRASLTSRGGSVWALISTDPWGPDPSPGSLSTPGPNDTGLVQSDDGGTHWKPVRVAKDVLANTQGWYDQVVMAPPGSSGLVASGVDVWYTPSVSPTHPTWSNLTQSYDKGTVHPDQHAMAAVDAARWFIGNDGGLWSTVDSGTSWRNINSNLGVIQFVGISADAAMPDIYFGGSQDNGTSFSASMSSLTWGTSYGGDGGYTSTSPKNSQERFTENFGVSLQRSDYFGAEWQTVVDGDTVFSEIVDGQKKEHAEAFYIPYVVIDGDPEQVALGTFRVWEGPAVPTAPGAGWKPISDDLTEAGGYIQAMAVAGDSRTIYAVTSNGIVQTNEGAMGPDPISDWHRVGQSDLPSNRPFGAVSIDPTNPQVVYVGVLGFGSGHVFKTKNAGKTWTDITGNLQAYDTPVNSIFIDPRRNTDVYVATDIGVFVADDAGESTQWQRYGSGLPRSAILQLRMSSLGTPTLVAATHGRGAWKIPPLHESPDFWLSLNHPTQNIARGGSPVPLAVTIEPVNNYIGSVRISCLSIAPQLKCNVDRSTLGIRQTATLTLRGPVSPGVTRVQILASDGHTSHYQTAVLISGMTKRSSPHVRLPKANSH